MAHWGSRLLAECRSRWLPPPPRSPLRPPRRPHRNISCAATGCGAAARSRRPTRVSTARSSAPLIRRGNGAAPPTGAAPLPREPLSGAIRCADRSTRSNTRSRSVSSPAGNSRARPAKSPGPRPRRPLRPHRSSLGPDASSPRTRAAFRLAGSAAPGAATDLPPVPWPPVQAGAGPHGPSPWLDGVSEGHLDPAGRSPAAPFQPTNLCAPPAVSVRVEVRPPRPVAARRLGQRHLPRSADFASSSGGGRG